MRDTFATTTRGLRRDSPPMHLFEEAKHVDFFARFFEEVVGNPGDGSQRDLHLSGFLNARARFSGHLQ